MPPFRAGLQKRKISAEEIKRDAVKSQINNSSDESGSEEELLGSGLDAGGPEDATDSEGEGTGHSDTELDGVLFDEDADSTLGDDERQDEDASDESSELPDSDADDENEEDDQEQTEDDSESASDSGEESGLGQTHSGSSDEEEQELHINTKNENSKTVEKKTKQKSKKDKSKTNKPKIKEINISSKQLGPKQNSTQLTEQKSRKDTKKKTTVSEKQGSSALDNLQKQIEESHIVEGKDEYESGDTSDEEERRNTAGDVPMWWYNEYTHCGYDLDGRRIIKPPQRDQIDEFLQKCEDPDFWRTVRDPATGQDIVLSKSDLELLARIKQGHVPNAEHDEYKPWVEWFTREVLATPVRAFPEHKRSFLPSRSEQQQVSKLVHALKMGWIKTRKQLADERKKKREKLFYNLWGSTTSEEEEKLRGIHKHIPAPRRALPGHAESYNPPAEYLLDSKEMKEWRKLSETPWKRKYTFLPTQHQCLRHVPAYERFTRERFLRCLDLYLAPRAIKMRLTISPEDLVPKLPSPRDLQPFPTAEVLRFRGHKGIVRSCDFDPSGQYVVSSSEDGTVKVWESGSGRCLRSIEVGAGAGVARVAWTPAKGLSLIAAAVGPRLLLLNPGADIGAHSVARATDELLEEPPPQHDVVMEERTVTAVTWDKVKPEEWARGVRVALTHFKPITHVSWHARGDYVCVTLADGASRAVLVHQLSRRRSQLPFSKSKGQVQCALFHPVRPFLFVATQRVVRVYDLVKQELVKKLLTGAQWISNMAIHPAGDNLLVSSYDRKCIWFDLDLSSKPYQTLRLHGKAVRAVAFHRRYPLFASAGDDRYVVVSHGMVYNDLLQNPLLVPLKQLPAGEPRDQLCSTDLRWHPAQPWLLVAGADACMRLYA